MLVAIGVGMLAAPSLTNAANPVVGALDALGTTATRQLDAVSHSAENVPLPTSTDITPVGEDASQTVNAVPQAAGAAVATARTAADGAVEQTRALEPPKGDAPIGSAEQTPPLSPSHPRIPAVVQQAGHAVAGTTRVLAVDDRAAPLRAIHAAGARGSSSASERLAHLSVHAATIAHELTSAPAAHELRGGTSRLAGALLGAVGAVAKTANAVLGTNPLSRLVPPLQLLTSSKTLAEPIPADAGGRLLQIGAPASSPVASSSASAPTPSTALASTALGALPLDRIGSAPNLRTSPGAGRSAAPSPTPRISTTLAVAAGSAHTRSLPAGAAPTAPTPGGISMASGAGATGGLGAATSLALAMLLLLLIPPAVRRLRFDGDSLRAAQFTLIPERPG